MEVIYQFGLVKNNFSEVFAMIHQDLKKFVIFKPRDTKD